MNRIKQLAVAGPLLIAAMAVGASARASDVKDPAGMFSPESVSQARKELTRMEREFQVPVLIETIEEMPDPGTTRAEKDARINELAVERDRKLGAKGVYILIDKKDHVISNVLVPGWLARHFGLNKRAAVRDAFIAAFRKGDFDRGLLNGVSTLGNALQAAQAEAGGRLHQTAGPPARPGPVGGPPVHARGGGSGFMALIWIVVVIIGIVLVIRLLGSLFRPAGMGPGMGPGMGAGRMGGPGYGGYGGGGGGGFWSSLFGGIGGAMAGNWIYDQMSGRHHGGYGGGTYGAPEQTSYDAGGPGDNEIVGANDPGTGDWGGGDTGGGGDWGGGGGGDWGGGGGGDFGGGGGGGGDW